MCMRCITNLYPGTNRVRGGYVPGYKSENVPPKQGTFVPGYKPGDGLFYGFSRASKCTSPSGTILLRAENTLLSTLKMLLGKMPMD